MKINKYEDISQIEREAKRDYIDRHSAFVSTVGDIKKGEKSIVKIKVGDEYQHPSENDHFISYVQLWEGENMIAQANFSAATMGNAASQVEVDFYIVPAKDTLKLTATAYCTKHGLWQSDELVVEVQQ